MKILSNTNINKDVTAKNQIISEAANGTPPLVVSSNTVVPNLNADLLDGQHGSYYRDWANITNKPTFATVATTGSYNDLSNKPDLTTKVDKNNAITAGTKTKITYDAKGLVTGGTDLVATDIPNLDATKITTGTFADARIPALAASKITSGTFVDARIPSLSPSKITQDANNRFVTDTEKSAWNAKQDKLTLNSGQVLGRTSTGSGSPEAVDTINISQIKVSDLDESSLYALKDEIPKIWTGTQAQYDAIVTKDTTTLYFITE